MTATGPASHVVAIAHSTGDGMSLADVVGRVRRRDIVTRGLMLLIGVAGLALGVVAGWLYFESTPLWLVIALFVVSAVAVAPTLRRTMVARSGALRGAWSQSFRKIVVEEDGNVSHITNAYLILHEDGILIRRMLPSAERGQVEFDIVRIFFWDAIASVEYVADNDSWTAIVFIGQRVKVAPVEPVAPDVARVLSTLGVAVPLPGLT